jgi:hypothetical protein
LPQWTDGRHAGRRRRGAGSTQSRSFAAAAHRAHSRARGRALAAERDRPHSKDARLESQIAILGAELANLADTAARGAAVLAALARREDDRCRLAAELAVLTRSSRKRSWQPADLRAQFRRFLDEWHGLLADDPAKARGLLDLALTDRIGFTPNLEHRRYELTIPVAFDRPIVAVVPELRGLQEMMASPTGTARRWSRPWAGFSDLAA